MLKVGVQSAGWYNANDPLGSFKFIKECGFEAVDFNIDSQIKMKRMLKEGIYPTIFDKSVEELKEFYAPLKQAIEETGVIISQMHAPFPTWIDGQDELNAHMYGVLDKCFAICEYLGCPAIVVHPLDWNPDVDEMQANIGYYSSLIPLIKKYKGVKICSENIYARFPEKIVNCRFCDAEDACVLIDTLNEMAGGDYFGFCLDVGHANITKAVIGDFIRTLGPRLTVLHIHDNNGVDDHHVIPYTCLIDNKTTVCDWDGFVEGLKDIGFKGVLAFETFRIFKIFPKSTIPAVLKLISAIGAEWVTRLTAE